MEITAIIAAIFPYDRERDLYQQYYRSALRAFCAQQSIPYTERSGARSDSLLRFLRGIRNSYKLLRILPFRWFPLTVDRIARLFTREPLFAPDPVGAYQFLTGTGSFTVRIDATDSGNLRDDILATADVYFKSNFWKSRAYARNVLPIANLNPLVDNDPAFFRSLRGTPKTLDLFAFIRIWGGDDEVTGIEHNLRLVESLARVNCSKLLCAYLVAGDIPAIGQRLDRQGIAWTTRPLEAKQLWAKAAASRLNIVRLGMHECIPWRMTDILAMGGCPVVDYGPRTQWPAPLVEGEHYLSLRAEPDAQPPEDLPARVEQWLADPLQVAAIAHNTAAYFDQHLNPIAIGRDIVTRATAFVEPRA